MIYIIPKEHGIKQIALATNRSYFVINALNGIQNDVHILTNHNSPLPWFYDFRDKYLIWAS